MTDPGADHRARELEQRERQQAREAQHHIREALNSAHTTLVYALEMTKGVYTDAFLAGAERRLDHGDYDVVTQDREYRRAVRREDVVSAAAVAAFTAMQAWHDDLLPGDGPEEPTDAGPR